jgi:hypothetical protein
MVGTRQRFTSFHTSPMATDPTQMPVLHGTRPVAVTAFWALVMGAAKRHFRDTRVSPERRDRAIASANRPRCRHSGAAAARAM